jgi:hypothetical protein
VLRAVGDPGLGLAIGQADRDERGADVVDTQRSADRATLEKFRATDSGGFQVAAKLLGQLVYIEG